MSAVSGSETEQGLAASGLKPPLAVPRRLLRLRSDAALAERFAAGDEAAFDVIYERHRPVVLAVCMGVLGTPPDAEDATQETFSALAVALRTRPPAELRPWLIRVARNASIDTTRRRRHRLLTLDGEIPEIAARPHGSGQAELAVVLDGIRELPEGQRMALLMRELGGHSYSEIAEFLATDEEAVKGLIARARVGLRAYREATELSCAAARNTIAAEPDGRRYDKTIRRHLRGCSGCRSYRDALRDDAKALRAALPIQAGTVATGSLSGGMVSAAKGSLIGYGLTQAATTCAASACAVGAIGGMVFVAPVHRLGLPPILPSTSVLHRHAAAKAAAKHAVVHASPTTVVTVAHPESTGYAPAEAADRPAVTHRAAAEHPRRHVTWMRPAPHRHHRGGTHAVDHTAGVPAHPARATTAGATTAAANTAATGAAEPTTAGSTTAGAGTPVGTDQSTQADQTAQAASAAPSSETAAATGTQSGEQGNQGDGSHGDGSHGDGSQGAGSPGNGHGHGWGSGGHGNPWRTAVAVTGTAAAAGASTPDPAAATTTPAVTATTTTAAGATTTADTTTTASATPTASPTTTSPATTTTTVSASTATTPQVAAQPGNGWGRGRGGTHHGGGPYQGTAQTGSSTQPAISTTPSTTTTMPASTSTPVAGTGSSSSSPWAGSHGGGHGHGGWGQ
jgi:RNA polymerase sigma factor (sigma-70 family)